MLQGWVKKLLPQSSKTAACYKYFQYLSVRLNLVKGNCRMDETNILRDVSNFIAFVGNFNKRDLFSRTIRQVADEVMVYILKKQS